MRAIHVYKILYREERLETWKDEIIHKLVYITTTLFTLTTLLGENLKFEVYRGKDGAVCNLDYLP